MYVVRGSFHSRTVCGSPAGKRREVSEDVCCIGHFHSHTLCVGPARCEDVCCTE